MIGNWIDKTEFTDVNNIDFSLKKNGSIVQNGNSSKMIWKFDELISDISKYFTLKIGDIIFTGTPSGVGKVNINDRLEGFIENRKNFNINIK